MRFWVFVMNAWALIALALMLPPSLLSAPMGAATAAPGVLSVREASKGTGDR